MRRRQSFRLERKDDPQEATYLDLVGQTNPKAMDVVKEARAMGLPWLNILRLLLEYGPKAIEKIRELLDLLFPPEPEVEPVQASKSTPAAGK